LRGHGSPATRNHVISQSTGGEFGYQEGPWKIVFLNQAGPLDKIRGNSTIAELYNLENDVAETNNVAEANPQIVQRLTRNLKELIDRGTSRPGPAQSNDTLVDFRHTQSERWGPALQDA